MADPKYRREVGRWRIVACVLLLIVLALLVAIIVILVKIHTDTDTPTCGNSDTSKYGHADLEESATSKYGHVDLEESATPSVFRDLTSEEINGLMTFLHSRQELHLVKEDEMKVNSSYVFLSELHLPNKQSVLDYLDKKGQKPTREAHVILFRGDNQPPDIEEIIVGPLPNPTGYRKVPYRPQSIPFIYRPINGPESTDVHIFLKTSVEQILGNMLEELYGGRLLNCGNKCVIFTYRTPVASSVSGEKRRQAWYWLSYSVEYYTLHSLDFAVLVDMDGPIYTIKHVWFHGQIYNSLNDVLNFYIANKGELTKIKFPDISKNLFSSMNQRGTPPIDPPLRNPVQISPDGKRYNIKDRHVEYKFWEFDFRMSTVKGPQLYDIRFKNERIAYELSLQEIAVFYSGNKPIDALAHYLDGFELIGLVAKGLVPGVDCPEDATFISTTFQVESDGPIKNRNAFCLFEYNMGIPLRRHASYSHGGFYEGMETTVLILRTISVIANYDYIVDFMFYLNGGIQVKVMSTGFVLGTVYTEEEVKYSFKLREMLGANIHQHLFNFKVDLDIKGTSNRFTTADVETEDIVNKFSTNPNARLIQHKFTTNLKTTELEAVYKYNFETPKYLLVYSEEDRNINGHQNAKCYRIINKGMSKQMLPKGSGNEPSISWARYQVAMTRFKDMETTSSSVYATLDAEDPVVHFQNFLDDDESIVDKVSIRLIIA